MNFGFWELFSLLAFPKTLVDAQNDWTYGTGPNGLDKWSENYKICTAFEQSPVDLNTDAAEYMKESRAVVEINSVTPLIQKFELTNDGRMLYLDVFPNTWRATLNSDAPDRYEVYQITFHWGSDNSLGSEHRKNKEFYPLEMQILSYDKELYTQPNLTDISANGMAIISVLFRKSDTPSDLANQGNLVKALKNVTAANTSSQLDSYDPKSLLPTNRKKFFRYYGSLTTPPCHEKVLWTVLESTLSVSEDELKAFRELQNTDGTPMQNNFRPIQILSSLPIALPRVLYKSWNGTLYVQFSWILIISSFLIHVI